MIRDILQGTAWGVLFGAAWFAASLGAALVIGRCRGRSARARCRAAVRGVQFAHWE